MKEETSSELRDTGRIKPQMTGKVTPIGMEAHYIVPVRNILPLLPHALAPASFFGLGMISVGAWYHSDAFIDDVSYGEALEVWSGVLVRYKGKTLAFTHTIFNSNPRYADDVSDIFKFTKIHATIEWKEDQGWQKVSVLKNGEAVMSFRAKPTLIPSLLPISKPRSCYVLKDGKRYLVIINMKGGQTRLARTKLEFTKDGPFSDFGKAISPVLTLSFFYRDYRLEVPAPVEI
jgi:hypothetical protein